MPRRCYRRRRRPRPARARAGAGLGRDVPDWIDELLGSDISKRSLTKLIDETKPMQLAPFTSPMGRGRRAKRPGSGVSIYPVERSPLTPTLSPTGRGSSLPPEQPVTFNQTGDETCPIAFSTASTGIASIVSPPNSCALTMMPAWPERRPARRVGRAEQRHQWRADRAEQMADAAVVGDRGGEPVAQRDREFEPGQPERMDRPASASGNSAERHLGAQPRQRFALLRPDQEHRRSGPSPPAPAPARCSAPAASSCAPRGCRWRARYSAARPAAAPRPARSRRATRQACPASRPVRRAPPRPG